ncbi:MAG TPA: glycine/sarcosine/betaine reductase selenoprotein B family protein [Anaerolineae bacterium]|nr:glycine/sarcosine/betaine reductase selenoprotein B family protein [Anaerolineae bacterium]
MSKTVDSYLFATGLTKRLIKSWIKLESPREMPWTPLSKPLSQCTVALITSGGIALKTDRPFDQEGERRNPWWGDPSYRVIPHKTRSEDIRVYHQHIDPSFAEQDINCLLPLDRLEEMVEAGEVGRSAASHYSFMGYILDPRELLEKTVPEMVRCLQADGVDVVVLVPA